MKAPEGCASISINGEQFPVDECGYALIPLNCMSQALERGFIFYLSDYKPVEMGKVKEPEHIEVPLNINPTVTINDREGKTFECSTTPFVEKRKKKTQKDA